jgi:bromodomain adjacent to zinc finger domain protein 1A
LTKLDEAVTTPKDSPTDVVSERHSARQQEKINAQHDAEYFEMPVENIQWDKISAEDRVRMKDTHSVKEAELVDQVNELQHGFAVCTLGRDRTFRRYWIFRSIPGLFVEDDEEHVPDDFFEPIAQNKLDDNSKLKEDASCGVEEKSTSSDKENDSFDHGKSSELPLRVNSIVSTDKNIQPLATNDGNLNGDELKSTILSDVKEANINVYDQISQRNKVKWAYYGVDQLDMLIDSLNSRGYREGALRVALVDQKKFLAENLTKLPVEDLTISGGEKTDKQVKYQNVKSRKKMTQGAVQNASAQEFLELNLREMLLDIEERIYVGSLGSIKVCGPV